MGEVPFVPYGPVSGAAATNRQLMQAILYDKIKIAKAVKRQRDHA